jgi:hypothetical protein
VEPLDDHKYARQSNTLSPCFAAKQQHAVAKHKHTHKDNYKNKNGTSHKDKDKHYDKDECNTLKD